MKTHKSIITNCLLILFIFMIVSCDNKKDALSPIIIPLASTVGDYNVLNLSDFATDIKYIPLETNNSVLIGQVIRNIFYENEEIFILDATFPNTYNCYFFDNNGKYSRKIGKRGQGPNDYLDINQVSIHEDLIYLMAMRKILVYDISGRLVKNINLQSNNIPVAYSESSMCSFIPLRKDAFVVSIVKYNGYYPTAYLFETNQSTVATVKEYPGSVSDKVRRLVSGYELGNMYHFKDDVRLYKASNDTIFTIGQNKEMKEAFIFDLGKYKIPSSYFEWETTDRETNNRIRSNYIIVGNNITESLSHLFIKFDFGNHSPEPFESTGRVFDGKFTSYEVYGIFDKVTGGLTLMRQPIKGKLGFKNDIDNGPVIWPHYISSNNELVTYIYPEDFMEYFEKTENPTPRMTEIAKNLKIDDNPIVIIAKLKK